MSNVILTILLALSLVYCSFASIGKKCPGCLPEVTCKHDALNCVAKMGEKEAKGITQEALDEYGKQYPDFKLTLKKYVNGRKQVVAGMRYWLELSVLSHPKQLFCAPTTKQLNVTVYQPPGETKPNFKYYEEPNFARCQH